MTLAAIVILMRKNVNVRYLEPLHQQWCDVLTGKLLSYYPLIDFFQQNIVVESDDSALAYTDLS